jgi:hypothetical protein
MPPRPGWKRVTVVENGREATLNVRDDPAAPPEPTQAELAAELEGAVFVGRSKIDTERRPGRRDVVQFDVFVDIDNPRKSWRRYMDGTIVRNHSVERNRDEVPVPLGVITARWTGESATDATYGPVQSREPATPEPNPFDGLDPATQRAISAALGLRR